MAFLSVFTTPYLGVSVAVLYFLYLAVQRLYSSPIAAFPGPRLAALTFWFEFYYDVVRKGRYAWKIRELHQKYGPIVRINPYELHVDDPDAYDEIYVGPWRRTEKWAWSARIFGTPLAAVGTTSHELHRLRRGALNPFFSKRSVTQLEPSIRENVELLVCRLRSFAGSQRPVNLMDAFACLSADIIGSYAFGRSYGLLNSTDFSPAWHKLMLDLSRNTHLMKQFAWGYELLKLVPQSLLALLHPVTRGLFEIQDGIREQIGMLRASAAAERRTTSQRTVLQDLLSSKLPPEELTTVRLTEEATTLLGAGTVTTAHTLSVIVYHLLSHPEKLSIVRGELATVQAGSDGPVTWQQLERLSYLSATVTEGLRMSYGVSHRLQRVCPDHDLQLCGWTVPAGTPVSMSHMDIHENPTIFADPSAFSPERWLSDDATRLRRYLVPFSRGTRQCLGINLSYAELFLTLGALFAPGAVSIELFQTDRSDVDCVHDFFNPSPRLDSKGVRVLVK